MAWHKRVLRNGAVRAAACWFAAWYIRLVCWSTLWRVEGQDPVKALVDADTPGIVCFWHGRLLMMSHAWIFPRPFNMLISNHADGQLIARTIGHLGVDTVAGSSSKGGSAAFRRLMRALKAGEWVGMTPDGPRGPRMRAGLGAVTLAKLSGAPLVPLVYSVKRGPLLGSWDRFLLAMPFNQGVMRWGAPIHVPGDADDAALEEARRALEAAMNQQLADVDAEFGRTVVDPAPEPASEPETTP